MNYLPQNKYQIIYILNLIFIKKILEYYYQDEIISYQQNNGENKIFFYKLKIIYILNKEISIYIYIYLNIFNLENKKYQYIILSYLFSSYFKLINQYISNIKNIFISNSIFRLNIFRYILILNIRIFQLLLI